LGAFAKAKLKPGQARTFELAVDPRLLATYEAASNSWTIKAGTYRLLLGQASDELPLSAEVAFQQTSWSAAHAAVAAPASPGGLLLLKGARPWAEEVVQASSQLAPSRPGGRRRAPRRSRHSERQGRVVVLCRPGSPSAPQLNEKPALPVAPPLTTTTWSDNEKIERLI
jgi:Fibronectin type III-like domain